MDSKKQESIALFKFKVISSLINPLEDGLSLHKRMILLSNTPFLDYKGESVKVSFGTIERWYYDYLKKGFDGLKPSRRADVGVSRKIDNDVFERIKYYKAHYPRIPATLIYQKLIADGLITRKTLSLSSVNRVINKINTTTENDVKNEMRRYEREHINEVWCGDTSYGPYVSLNGKKCRTYIIAFIDDASRMITSADIFLNDNYINMVSTLKKGIVQFGKPKLLNFDNGKSYKNKQMELLGARIGTSINYCAPYQPIQKAKIERWFRTLKDKWMSQYNKNSNLTLDGLRKSLLDFVKEYNNTIHSSLKKTPNDRFFSESPLIKRLSDETLNYAFLLEIERKVTADNVITIDKVNYEVDYKYAKKRITLRYSKDLSEVYVVDAETGELTEIKLLNKIDNSTIKRNKVRYAEAN